jgi:hypothetical protein
MIDVGRAGSKSLPARSRFRLEVGPSGQATQAAEPLSVNEYPAAE